MFSKVLILVLLGTSLVLADPTDRNIVTKEYVKQIWIGKVNELIDKFDKTCSKHYNKGQYKLQEVVNTLKLKNSDVVAVADGKWDELQQKYQAFRNKVKESIEEKKTSILAEIEKLEGEITHSKYMMLKSKAKLILGEEKIKFKAEVQTWYSKVQEVKEEAKDALREIEFQEILDNLQQIYGDIYEANKDKLIELKEKYQQTKQQAKISIEQKKQRFKNELLELKGKVPEKYRELKIKAHKEIAAEKSKWKLIKEQIKQEAREIIAKMKSQLIQN